MRSAYLTAAFSWEFIDSVDLWVCEFSISIAHFEKCCFVIQDPFNEIIFLRFSDLDYGQDYAIFCFNVNSFIFTTSMFQAKKKYFIQAFLVKWPLAQSWPYTSSVLLEKNIFHNIYSIYIFLKRIL